MLSSLCLIQHQHNTDDDNQDVNTLGKTAAMTIVFLLFLIPDDDDDDDV